VAARSRWIDPDPVFPHHHVIQAAKSASMRDREAERLMALEAPRKVPATRL